MAAVVIAVTFGLFASPAWATEPSSATCRRLDAEARANAAVLYAPRVELQALRLPEGADVDEMGNPLSFLDGYQVRGAVSFSPVDILRGMNLRRTADADCERHLAAERIEDVLRQGVAYGQAEALRAEIALLDERLPRVDEILRDTEARLERQLITRAEVDAVRLARLRLQRKRSLAARELALLEAQGGATATHLGADLAAYDRASLAGDGRRSRQRLLASWDVQLKLGVVAADTGEWFGMLSFTYDIGRLWQSGHERRALDARRDELATSRAELTDKVARFRQAMAGSVREVRAELALVDAEAASLKSRLEDLRRVESEAARAGLSLTEIELTDVESDQMFLRSLLAAREAVQ